MNNNYQKENDIMNRLEQIQRDLGIDNVHLINSSSKIIAAVLFDSENKPWKFQVNALSSYVDWLYMHSIHVSVISTLLAQVLAVNEVEEIALGAFLHDIGKIRIPKSIIQKPGRLTEEEFFCICQHCDLGIDMVKGFNLPQISLDIIKQHHERLDGSGYPQGLCGGQIPLHSRIAIVADILDAITSYRPYRPQRSIQSALDELLECPSKYPQEVLEAFSSLLHIPQNI